MCWLKRMLSAVMLTVMPLVAMAFSTWDGASAAPWTKGSGAASSPYIIETAEQLAYLAQQVNAGTTYSGKYFKMAADIDLNGKQWTPIGTDSAPFKGIFEGGHHIVYNLYISNDNIDRVGLFGYVADGGISSLGVENCNIKVYDHSTRQNIITIGAVAAFVSNSSTLEYCYATGKTNVFNDAGDECTPYNSHWTITGGVFGRVENTDVMYCYNEVDMTEGTHRDAGGVIGYGIGSTVTFCYNAGDVRALYCRAGILGWSGATNVSERNEIFGCYNSGSITTCQPIGPIPDNNNYNGGIVACAAFTSIYNCYTVGYMDNYLGNSSFAIAANELAWVSLRNSNYHLNTINVNHFDQPRCGQQATRNNLTSATAPTIIGQSYYRKDFGSNNDYPIHYQNIYNTETCDAELTGELSVMLDASVYAHNRTAKGIAWGVASADPTSWTEHSTMDSVLNHIEAKNLQYDVLYGYRAYQTVVTGKVYGKNRYFQISKDTFCEGDEYKFHGKTFATGGDFAVVDGDYTYFLHLNMLPKIEVTLPQVSECYEYTWEGQTTKQTTVLKTVVKSVLCGCDSTTYQPVTIKDSVVVELPAVSECYEYTWEEQTTKKSARLRKLDTGANGCDSITYQPVIIKDSVVVTLPEVEECYEYTWEGQTTKQTTVLKTVVKSVLCGCDSITYQPVTIRDSVVVTLPLVKACNFYDWEGMHTEESVDFRKLDTGANGCDSITYQPVEIYYSVEEYIEDTSYLLEPYKKNGFDLPVQTEIGDFNFELQLTTADKCDSTVYLLLHVIPNTNLDVIPAKFVEFRDGRFNWQIKNVEHYPNIHILIYDRFSRKVAEYRGYDNNNGWDGRYNGHLLPATDYWYWMKDDLIKGIITGHFTLYYK
ncbi:MAG: T9SS type B sorting domain-containing protein [Paludibacteraceae bacterium]|nr:T9SS type B sorting domain-containing protein [Paludibacteraceae bacterium]